MVLLSEPFNIKMFTVKTLFKKMQPIHEWKKKTELMSTLILLSPSVCVRVWLQA